MSLLEAAEPARGQTPDCRISGEQERFVLQSSPMERRLSVNFPQGSDAGPPYGGSSP
jgi:hypothetical protein